MNAEAELMRAYREWRRLAQAESKAIQTHNWVLLSDCHLAIRDYQSLVGVLTQQARSEWREAGNLAEKENNRRALVSGLIELTRQNHARLQAALGTARKQLDELGEAGKNLKRLQRSYGVAAKGGAWLAPTVVTAPAGHFQPPTSLAVAAPGTTALQSKLGNTRYGLVATARGTR